MEAIFSVAARQAPLSSKGRGKKQFEKNQRAFDTLAIILIAFGAIALVSLLTTENGVLGGAFAGFLKNMFGIVAYIVPVFFWGVSFLLLFGSKRLSKPHILQGGSLILLSILAGAAKQNDVNGDWFDPVLIKTGGGFLGALLSIGLHSLLGTGAVVIIATVFVLGALLIINISLPDLFAKISGVYKQFKRPVVKLPSSLNPRTKMLDGKETHFKTAAARIEVNEASSQAKSSVMDMLKKEGNVRAQPLIQTSLPFISTQPAQTEAEHGYTLPPITLLNEPPPQPKKLQHEINNKIEILEKTLTEFGIGSNVLEIAHGPTVTRYEIELAPGIKVSKVVNLADNLALSLAAIDIRVEAPIPGKSAIGVEVPNDNPQMVTLREVIDTKEFWENPSRLIMALGKDVAGNAKYADLAKMPHLLIGGATNSGKSVGLGAIISSLIYRNTPKELRLVLIDPKRVELSLFEGIPHLMHPVVKDVKLVPGILKAVIKEMEKRYDVFARMGVRNIDGHNEKVAEEEKLPYLVVIIDELADLMIQAAAEVEQYICRLAQLARATGIHLVVATQRPSVDVITGTIKANISSRIAFAVSSQVDSRTILDLSGAERLIGKGDMLFMPIDASKPVRVQGCYISDSEQESLVDFWKAQDSPTYSLQIQDSGSEQGDGSNRDDEEEDALYAQAIRHVVGNGQASTSMLQRRFRIGYGRAARLLDMMERRGIVGPLDGPRPREILISKLELEDLVGLPTDYSDR